MQKYDCSQCTYQKDVRKCSLEEVRDNYESNPNPIIIKGEKYYKCPAGYVDWKLWTEAYRAYEVMDSGHLYYEGGLANQTDFFVKSAYLVKKKLKQKEAEDMKKASKKKK